MTVSTQHGVMLSDVVSLHERPSNALRVRPTKRAAIADYRIGRRNVLRAAVVLGTTAGLTTLGIFPKARTAAAACVARAERTISGPCPVNVGDCSPACGPSTVYLDACNANDWHKYTGNYRNRPNQCNSTGSDGWNWYANCACPSGCLRAYRCHDGCKLVSGAWRNSICRRTGSGCIC